MARTNTQVVYKKRGGFLPFLGGFLFAIVFIVGSIVGAGFWAYNSLTIRQIEDVVGIEIPIGGELKDQPLKVLISQGLEAANGYANVTIFELEDKYKVALPQEIPGTGIPLVPMYESTITFLGKTQTVYNTKIIDIANNVDEFLKVAKDVVLNNIFLGQVLAFANIDVEDFGYPIFTDPTFFNVGTETTPVLKGFNNLSLNQAIKLLPDYLSSENLTYGLIERATGLSLLPAAPATGVDDFAYLRNTPFVDLSIPELMDNVTLGIALGLLHTADSGLDLAADFAFMDTEEFKNTRISDIMSYVNTYLTLGDLVKVPSAVDGTSPVADRLLFSLAGLKVGDIINGGDPMNAIANQLSLSGLSLGAFVTLNSVVDPDVFDELSPKFRAYLVPFKANTLDSLNTSLSVTPLVDMLTVAQMGSVLDSTIDFNLTLSEVLALYAGDDLATVLAGLDLTGLGYLKALGLSTNATIEADIAALTVAQFTGLPASVVANLAGLQFADLLTSPDLLGEVINELGADTPITQLLGLGAGAGGIMSVLDEITLSDLLDPSALEGKIDSILSGSTIGELLGNSADTGLLGALMTLSITDIQDDAQAAIAQVLKTSGLTLGGLLGNTSTDGIMSALNDIPLADLFDGATIEDVLLGAISDVTLSDLMGSALTGALLVSLSDSTINSLATDLQNIKLSAIITADPSNPIITALLADPNSTIDDITDLIDGLTVLDVFGDSTERTGILKLLDDDALVKDIGTATFALEDLTILELKDMGIIDPSVNAVLDGKTFGWLIEVLSDPANAAIIVAMT